MPVTGHAPSGSAPTATAPCRASLCRNSLQVESPHEAAPSHQKVCPATPPNEISQGRSHWDLNALTSHSYTPAYILLVRLVVSPVGCRASACHTSHQTHAQTRYPASLPPNHPCRPL